MVIVPPRPYALVKGSEPSATGILSMLPKDGLVHAAARETSVFAVSHQDKWAHLPEEDAINRLAGHFRGTWDGRAAIGTLVHKFFEMYCNGEEVQNPVSVVEHMIANDPKAKAWVDRDFDDLLDEVFFGYVNGLEEWWGNFWPTSIRSEVVVRWPGLYIGTADARCVIDGEDWLLDLKTGKKPTKKEPKNGRPERRPGVYADSWTLQLALYGMARETVSYGVEQASEGTKPRDWTPTEWKRGWRVVETGTGEWTRPQRYGVIHLLGDGDFAFLEMDVNRDVERTALRLARAYHGWRAIPDQPRIIQRKEQAA